MSGKQELILPTYKPFQNMAGGLNVSAPADQIDDTQSSDLLNLIYINGVLQVDTGYVQYGNRVVGTPLQPIQFELINGTLVDVLVTSTAFYVWSVGINDWQLAMTSYLTTTWGSYYDGLIWSQAFSFDFGPPSTAMPVTTVGSASGVSMGDIVQVVLTSGDYYTSTVISISGNTLTFADSLLPGTAIAAGAAVMFFKPLNGGSYGISWTTDPTTNTLIWTNGVDPVQAYNGQGVTAPLSGLSAIASTARLVCRYFGFTLAINTVENGVQYPYRVRRSSNVSSVDWTSYDITGYDDLIDTPDAITSVALIGAFIVLGREETVMTGEYWGTATATFFWQYGLTGMGVLEGKALLQDVQNAILVSNSGVYRYSGGYSVQSIGDPVFNYFLGPLGDLTTVTEQNFFSVYIYQLDEIWLFYPSTNAQYCDTLLRFSNKYGGWFPQKFDQQFAGASFAFQSVQKTWLTLVGDWTDQTGTWTGRSNSTRYPYLILASALDRLVYKYDFLTQTRAGAAIPWYFVSKDYPVLDQKLTFDGISAYGRGDGVLVEVSVDQGVTWLTIGTLNFGSTYTKQVLDFHVMGDFFRFRFSGEGYGFFLSQFALRYLSGSEY